MKRLVNEAEKVRVKHYKKTTGRDPEERKSLLDLALKKVEEKERSDFISVGYKRRRLRIQ